MPQRRDNEKERDELEAHKRRGAARVGEENAVEQMRDDPEETARLEKAKRKGSRREQEEPRATAQQGDNEEIVRDIEDRKRKLRG